MRNSDSATIAYLQAAPTKGYVVRQAVWITAANLGTGTPTGFGFWTDHLPTTIPVISGQDNTTQVNRLYAGDGALKSVDKITLTSDISVRTTSFVLSALNATVNDLWLNYRLKSAAVEIHRMRLDPRTRLLVAPPKCRFIGFVDTAPKVTAKVGDEGGLTINCVSTTALLTIINPAVRSDQTQQRRSGDRHSRYAGVVNQWVMYWGGNPPS